VHGFDGVGGMGGFRRARDTRLGPDVASTILPPEFGVEFTGSFAKGAGR
jgi:hypothetical protein